MNAGIDKQGLAVARGTVQHSSLDLERIFRQEFLPVYRTRLQGGADEPFYQPAGDSNGEHIIFYREDFFSSALHEVAHWCIAGEGRRQLPDFGYWYTPDGRNAEQQAKFEKVEVKPQAIECLFSLAANIRFRPSIDNFALGNHNERAFAQAVSHQVQMYSANGLPPRARQFRQALSRYYGGTERVNSAVIANMMAG